MTTLPLPGGAPFTEGERKEIACRFEPVTTETVTIQPASAIVAAELQAAADAAAIRGFEETWRAKFAEADREGWTHQECCQWANAHTRCA